MATTKSDIYTIQSQATGDNRADGRLLSGKVRQAQAVVTLDGDEAAGVIDIIELPKGAIVDPSQSYVISEVLTDGNFPIDLGFTSDANGLTQAAPIEISGGGKVFFDTTVTGADLVTIADGDEVISATCGTITGTQVANATFRVVITFVDRY
jgi:hypothetical protein